MRGERRGEEGTEERYEKNRMISRISLPLRQRQRWRRGEERRRSGEERERRRGEERRGRGDFRATAPLMLCRSTVAPMHRSLLRASCQPMS